MTKLIIKTELRKEYAHINGLGGDIIKILQKNTKGVHKITKFVCKNHTNRIKKAVENLKNSTLKNHPKHRIFEYINYTRGKIYFKLSKKALAIWHQPSAQGSEQSYYLIDLATYFSFSSRFEKALYELSCWFADTTRIKMCQTALKDFFNARQDDYKKPSRLLSKVLQPAIQAVEKNARIKFDVYEKKSNFFVEKKSEGVFFYAQFKPLAQAKIKRIQDLPTGLKRLLEVGIPYNFAKEAFENVGEKMIYEIIYQGRQGASNLNPSKRVWNLHGFIISELKKLMTSKAQQLPAQTHEQTKQTNT